MYIPEGYSLTPFISEERVTSFAQADMVIDESKDYMAIMETNKGRMVIDLYQDKTPKTVNNFVFLALNHYFDTIIFHRVLDNFMAQTGDPTGTGTGGPGYTFEDEFDPMLSHKGKGVLSMANRGPNTNGSQIFITFLDTPHLDGMHAVFGKIIAGDDVLDRIQRVDPTRPGSVPADCIDSVHIVEK